MLFIGKLRNSINFAIFLWRVVWQATKMSGKLIAKQGKKKKKKKKKNEYYRKFEKYLEWCFCQGGLWLEVQFIQFQLLEEFFWGLTESWIWIVRLVPL